MTSITKHHKTHPFNLNIVASPQVYKMPGPLELYHDSDTLVLTVVALCVYPLLFAFICETNFFPHCKTLPTLSINVNMILK